MKIHLLIIFWFAWHSSIYAQVTGHQDSLIEVGYENLDKFRSNIHKATERYMELYYEKDRSSTIEGFIYFLGDTLNVRLFYGYINRDTLTTFKPLQVFDTNRKKIINIFKTILGYRQNPCYQSDLRRNPHSNEIPEIDANLYWKYWLYYYENGIHKRVWRDKLSLKNDGCGSKSSKIRGRKDFEQLIQILNSVLNATVYPKI